MKLTKISLKGRPRWVEIDKQNNHYLLHGQNPTEGLTRGKRLNQHILKQAKFENLFWGRNIVGLALNYRSLVGKKTRYDEPLIFLKSFNSICPHQSRITYPRQLDTVWVEVELVIIIAKKCRRVSPAKAHQYIYGYTIGSDITAKNIADRDWHLARSKALDQFAPLGPWILKDLDTSNLKIATHINNKQYQQDNTANRILNDAQSVSLVSQFITLMPGDLIFTGTPSGATDSLVKSGDKVNHTIENIGQLSFTIR